MALSKGIDARDPLTAHVKRLRSRDSIELAWGSVGILLFAVLIFTTACSSGDDDDVPMSVVTDHVELRPLATSTDRRIVDDLDREVLLRGANVNSLGEYWQGDPDHPPTIAVTDADWEAMAERGISVVRLIITWSLVEPERGVIDQDYLDRVDGAVNAASFVSSRNDGDQGCQG